jgi:hypothetical protein
MTTGDDRTLAGRVAEARAIKAARDRAKREAQEHELAEVAEKARVREERTAAGLLGVCPVCKQDVDTAEGVVLRHSRRGLAAYKELNTPDCEGTGEPPFVTS